MNDVVMPLVRVMWLAKLSWQEREEVAMAIQRCVEDEAKYIESCLEPEQKREIGFTASWRKEKDGTKEVKKP